MAAAGGGMWRLVLILFSAAVSFTGVAAQQASPTPTSTPRPLPAPQETPVNFRSRTGVSSMYDGRPSMTTSQELAVRQLLLQKYAFPLYRKPSESELAAIAPSSDIVLRYKKFLEQKDTGIFKLVPDAGCSENHRVVVATDDCLKYTMPGAGNSYSFRTANYRIRHLADLMLAGDKFRIPGILTHGLLAPIGNIPLPEVSMRTPGIAFLTEFKPSTDFERAVAVEDLIGLGLERDGFVYSRSVGAYEDTTYAMRVIAYDGLVERAVPGAQYNEMDFDRRRDVIVAFRVVERPPDGSVTIIWIELSNTAAPKLKIPTRSTTLETPKGEKP
ncbi:MAG: hypothetical protein KA956_08645 [Pyrinomonadaceae bacterium]|nr:hypothetical protein [Acidobacteriota bacterium]MBK7933671.1 hypothetical protein [Acidobacteriota bacterium]MBP7376535.1 hypothetical protein [Pyrinomonadaceae bacterium]